MIYANSFSFYISYYDTGNNTQRQKVLSLYLDV